MSAPTHTPGPWEACEPGDYGDYHGQCVVILGDDKRVAVVLGEDAEAVANARVMAAAPELLWSLRWIMQGIAGCERDDKYQAARAAIAKATGEVA